MWRQEAEVNAETYLLCLSLRQVILLNDRCFLCRRGSMAGYFQSFAFGCYASDAMDFYISVHSLMNRTCCDFVTCDHKPCSQPARAKTIKKNTNLTQNKSETHHAKQYEVTSFLSTDCELSTETCSKNVYSLGPWLLALFSTKWSRPRIGMFENKSCARVGVLGKESRIQVGTFCNSRPHARMILARSRLTR